MAWHYTKATALPPLLFNFIIAINKVSSCGGLEVEHPLRIQLKAGHFWLGGTNPAWDIYMVLRIYMQWTRYKCEGTLNCWSMDI